MARFDPKLVVVYADTKTQELEYLTVIVDGQVYSMTEHGTHTWIDFEDEINRKRRAHGIGLKTTIRQASGRRIQWDKLPAVIRNTCKAIYAEQERDKALD